VVGAALTYVLRIYGYFFTFTVASPTTKRSLIIRTTIRTTTRERLKMDVFIWL